MSLSDAQRARFREELDRKGIDSMKAASIKAIWKSGPKAGKPLSDTYISQALNKGRGSYQGFECISEAIDLNWLYIIDGRRGNGSAAPSLPTEGTPDPTVIIKAIEDLCNNDAVKVLCNALRAMITNHK